MNPARSMLPSRALLAALAVSTQAGCYFSDEGLSPPQRSFYYPTGLAVSPGRRALYVANSDFDLQYNGGTVQVVDLETARESLGQLLLGLRCREREEAACVALGTTVDGPPSLADVCGALPYRRGGHANGADCTLSDECTSGACVEAKCQACATNADCPGNGACGASGDFKGVCVLAENVNTILSPSRCTAMAAPFAAEASTFATIGAFASGAVIAVNPEGVGAKLFIPVRGDPSITWMDIADDRDPQTTASVGLLDCGQCRPGGSTCADASNCCSGKCSGGQCTTASDDSPRCDDKHRTGLDPYDNFRTLTLPVEPVGLDVSDQVSASHNMPLLSTHQIADAPAIGLTEVNWDPANPLRPSFQFYLTGGVPFGPMEVAHVDAPAIVGAARAAGRDFAYQPGFLVTYNATAEVDLYRYDADELSSPQRPFITRAAQAGVLSLADGKDSRGIVVDPSARKACEATCAAADLACLRDCVATPLDFYMVNRSPPSLLLGKLRTTVVDSDLGGSTGSSAFDQPEVGEPIALTQGPSKVALGKIIGLDGQPTTRVFAVAFDSKRIFGYDPVARRVDTVIDTGRGPHAVALDTGQAADGTWYSYLYVGHFTDSYLGVVDLDMRHDTYATMFASIGTPTEPRESK